MKGVLTWRTPVLGMAVALLLWAAAPALVTTPEAELTARAEPAPEAQAPTPRHVADSQPSAERQPNAFFEAARFFPGLADATASPAPRGEGRLAGGLTSHHVLAGAVLSQLFLEVGEHPPATVIVVGPNHENHGQRVITGRRPWATDFGPVAADTEIVDRLVAVGLAAVDDRVLATEHAVGALMPYLKYHAPEAKVVPLVLHRDVTPAEVGRLADFLGPLLGSERLLVASVDFSHYLTRAEAEAMDQESWAAIQAFDLEALRRMGPEHLDSPPALGLLMLTMQRLLAAGPEVAAHTNSGLLLGSDSMETTSYFTLKYRLNCPAPGVTAGSAGSAVPCAAPAHRP